MKHKDVSKESRKIIDKILGQLYVDTNELTYAEIDRLLKYAKQLFKDKAVMPSIKVYPIPR